MNCKQVNAKLSAYLDGELDGGEMLLLRTHLQDCQACDDELATLRRMKDLLAQLPMPTVASDFEDRLLKSVFDTGTPARNSLIGSWKVVFASGLATAAAVLAVLQFYSASPQQAPVSQPDVNGQLARDQAIQAGPDPMSGGAPVILVNAR